MNIKLLFIGLALLCACDEKKPCADCNTLIGRLLFSDGKIEWGEIGIGESSERVLRVYNPTSEDILIQVFSQLPELRVVKYGGDSVDRVKEGFVLPALACDTLCFTFTPRDTSLIGTYSKGVLLEMDGELHLKPIGILATVLESFDTRSGSELLLAPRIEVEKEIFSFGTIAGNEKVTLSLKIKNRGKKDLIIRKTETDCTCTAAVVGKRVIGYNDSVVLEVAFNPMGRKGRQNKTVTLFCNDPERPMVKLMIFGDKR